MKASFKKYTLQFKQPAGTSRGVYKTRDSWFLFLEDNGITGIGECAPLPGLSMEPPDQIESQLTKVCQAPAGFIGQPELLSEWPSILFAMETALLDLGNGGRRTLFESDFTHGKTGIPINGLIWMGAPEYMKQQIREKLDAGFRCIKLKIGAIDFQTELEILQSIRKTFSAAEITLRVDANGAFTMNDAPEKLKRLADLDLHSIEQPVAAGRWSEMAELCATSPLPVALDEELIGITSPEMKMKLLRQINPAFVVLKPSLHGGISGCDEWIKLAEQNHTGWWITSYLESNIGLNAIAQWAAVKPLKMEQGLGTGQLFVNNFESPLAVEGGHLWYRTANPWNLKNLPHELV